jgi:hypothetical protein
VYLNVDPSHRINLNRGFEIRLKELTSSVRGSLREVPERERLKTALHHVEEFVSAHTPVGRGLALFFDAFDGFFWHEDLGFPVTDQIRWDRELFLQPLANAADQLEPYAVVLADRTSFRTFLVQFGKIEELVQKEVSSKRVRHVKTTGTDRAESSSRIQRKADNQVRSNLRVTAKEVDRLTKSRKLHRIVLAGTTEVTAELRTLLPARLAQQVVGEVPMAMGSTPADVLAIAQPLAEKYERASEATKVSNVLTAAAKDEKAVVGLGHTLKAVNSGRVWELVYCGGFSRPGFECSKCSALFSGETASCPYCNSVVQPVTNIVERAVEHVLRKRAKIEVVTGDAAAALDAAGGIGAFLKTRAGRIEA